MPKSYPTYKVPQPNSSWSDWSGSAHQDRHHEEYDPNRCPFTIPLANVLGGIAAKFGPRPAMAATLRTYAPYPVWRDSTTAEVKFTPMPIKTARNIWHKIRDFERKGRRPGKQDGPIGRNGLACAQTLIFDCLNYITGRLDPSIETIARKACISISSAKRGLANLKRCGVLFWIRRAAETRDEQGRFCLEQDTNAYAILPPSQWLGFIDRPQAPPPEPGTWGDHPPLPEPLDQAAEALRNGDRISMLAALEADPNDELAKAWASFYRDVDEKENRAESARNLSKNR